MREAITLYLKGLIENGLPKPEAYVTYRAV